MKWNQLATTAIAMIAASSLQVDAFFSSLIISPKTGRKQQSHPQLTKIVDSQHDTVLQIVLDIGKTGEAKLGIQGLKLELQSDPIPDNQRGVIDLPGINGRHPELSSGARKLNIQQEGGFVSLEGAQKVQMLHPCWELIWKKDAAAGSFVCGFDIGEEYQRNEAILPKGLAYLSFPVWTTEGLALARKQKELALSYVKEKEEALERFQLESNPILQALEYRQACVAAEKCWVYPIRHFDIVPDEHETMLMQGESDIWMATRGIIWSTGSGTKALIGDAQIAK